MLTRRHETARPSIPVIQDELNQLFNQFFEPKPMSPLIAPQSFGDWIPPIDVTETAGSFVIEAEVPGVDKDKIEISVAGNVLTLSGKREEVSETREEGRYHTERRFGMFRRSFDLPQTADLDNIKAEQQNGVLTISIGKTTEAGPRKIIVTEAK